VQYTVRTSISGSDERFNEICRIFSSMERMAYNLLMEERDKNNKDASIKFILRERYGIKNARWNQSVLNQAKATMSSQEEGMKYKIDLYEEKIRNTNEKIKHLSNELRISRCRAKLRKFQKRIDELREQLRNKSYPCAVFGSKKLFHQLSIAHGSRREELKKEWKEKRSNHFFSVGQSNQKGNANTKIVYDGGRFYLEIRNWFGRDFKLPLKVPEGSKDDPKKYEDLLKWLIKKAESVKLGSHGELVDGSKGLAYSVRVIRLNDDYQVLVSFDLQENASFKWNGKLLGIDINPEGIACTIVSKDGNLIATRFFKDNRLISASTNKRKWVLENLINRMLNWCSSNYNCNALAVEDLKFKGDHDYNPKTNMKLSNFMRKKMIETIKLHALGRNMIVLDVDPAYTSKVAVTKYGKKFGGFNRHQLAAFVIARRALRYKESPTEICLPMKKEEKRMWKYCSKNYCGYQSQPQTLLQHEPMECKSARADNGDETITELPKARPAGTSEKGLRSRVNTPADSRAGAVPVIASSFRQAGSVHSNPQAREGDGATGYRVGPAPFGVDNLLCHEGNDTKDTVYW
jgi:IS605 OrfB family transposase